MNQHSQNNYLKSVLNFRDIGGISAPRGKKLREGIIFRSANPDRISRMDIEKIRSLNIRTIIDLRAGHELNNRSISVDCTEKLVLPLDFTQTTRERLKPAIYKKDAEAAITEISNAIYLEILDASAPVFRQVMEVLASPDRCPVLIHCQAGKDRTGIIIALVLLSLGVERKLIINDFMKSNDALLPFFKKYLLIRKILTFGFFPYRNMLFVIMVKQRNIESILDRIEYHYGGIEAYLRYAGFDASRLAEVRNSLLTG